MSCNYQNLLNPICGVERTVDSFAKSGKLLCEECINSYSISSYNGQMGIHFDKRSKEHMPSKSD